MKLLQELHALALNESAMVNANAKHDMSAADLIEEIHDIFVELEQKYKKHEVASTSIAAAPNSSMFRAAVGGMIKHEHNVTTHGHYGGATVWKEFLKLGGGVHSNVRSQIVKDFQHELSKLIDRPAGSESTVVYCSDAKVIIGQTSGTNWGGIGAYPHRFESKYRPEPV